MNSLEFLTQTELSIIFCSAIMGYFLGSINSSLIVGRLIGKIDIRYHGSGNAGLTNTLRVLGKKAAILVLAGDILKGVLAIGITQLIYGFFAMSADITLQNLNEVASIAAGTACIFGHSWPIYFGFKGGKGVLTSAAVIFMLDWKYGLILLAIFAIVVSISKFVSLSSILCAIAAPFIALYLEKSIYFVCFVIVIAILVAIRHRTNIVRLLKGTESKLSFKK